MHCIHDDEAPIGTLLIHVSRLLREIARSRFTEIELHRGQAFVLMCLAHHDGSPQHLLAHGVHIKPATLTPMLQKLEEVGWITRETDPHDQRISRVYLTETGRTKQRQAAAVFTAIEAEFDALYSSSEREQLRQHLLIARQHLRDRFPPDSAHRGHGRLPCDASRPAEETI